MDERKTRFTVVPLLIAALLGGGVAATATTLLDGDDGGAATTTVVRQAPLSGGDRDEVGQGLTPRDIYAKYSPGVVFVRADVVDSVAPSPFDPFPQERRSQSTGTGFVIDKDGSILTNAHVVAGATDVRVQFADKRSVKARVIGRDVSTDLALLKVDPDGLKLTVLPLGSARDVEVGDPTIAIGNPFGLDRTLTTGVVSAKQRRITAPNGFAINDVIQTDAAINPGNSGGPLIDAAGEVIGVNSQIETGGAGRGNVGIGFAVPIDTAKRILGDLKKDGQVRRAYLGVTSRTVDGSLAALRLSVKSGALVQEVQPGSPADKAGLRAGEIQAQVGNESLVIGGDVVVAVDGKPVKTGDDLSELISARKPGDRVEIEIVRDGKHKTVGAELADRPETISPG